MAAAGLCLFRKKNVKVGLSISGFRLIDREVIYNNDRKDTVLIFEHRETGARVLYVQNNDHHRFFGIIFSVPTL
ncbi:MAG: hypothetical protein LBI29_02475, partial [Rickettsiales bacterium]|nr:hypothetical protein [Rickettsiales bacterium]